MTRPAINSKNGARGVDYVDYDERQRVFVEKIRMRTCRIKIAPDVGPTDAITVIKIRIY